MEKWNLAFITNLKFFRKKANLSQAELARRSNLSPGTVGDYETGRRKPSLDTVQKISEALNIPYHYLFFIPEEITKEKKEVLDKKAAAELIIDLVQTYFVEK